MQTFAHLKVFKDTYDLLVIIHKNTKNVPKEYKYTILESLKIDIKELAIIIYKTTLYQEQKLEYINLAREYIARVTIQSRALYDLKATSHKLNAMIIQTTQEIDNQLKLWAKYNADKINKKQPKNEKNEK